MKFNQLYNDIKTAIIPSIAGLVMGAGLSYLVNYPAQKYQIKFIYNYAEKESKLEEKIKESPKIEANIKFGQYMQYIKSEKSFNYKVKPGDNLNRISHHFFTLYTGKLIPSKNKIGNYYHQLKEINRINSEDIVPNQIIKIFPPKNIRDYKNGNYHKNIDYFLKLSRVLDKDSLVITSDYTSSRFHPVHRRRLPHEGIDLVSNYGSKVKPLYPGKVIFTGRLNGYGNTVIIESKNFEFLYAHLDSIKTKKGRKIKKGETIGIMGSSGETNGPHLHLSISKNKHKNEIDLSTKHSIDPYDFVAKYL